MFAGIFLFCSIVEVLSITGNSIPEFLFSSKQNRKNFWFTWAAFKNRANKIKNQEKNLLTAWFYPGKKQRNSLSFKELRWGPPLV
jgi:hypothetical protein